MKKREGGREARRGPRQVPASHSSAAGGLGGPRGRNGAGAGGSGPSAEEKKRKKKKKNQTASQPIGEQTVRPRPMAAADANEGRRREAGPVQKWWLLSPRAERAGPAPRWGRAARTRVDAGIEPMAGAATAERGRVPPSAPAPAPSTEGLPRAFLQSLRTLFDILDDRRRGCVHLREIESRWQGADARELPRGVLEGLRRVAPASGYLTFECFVTGLRSSLLSADGGPRDPTRDPVRPGDQPPPPRPPQRLVFAPADEPRTVLERKPLPLSARAPPAGPSGAARSPEQLCALAEAAAAACPAEPERPQSAALERSPSADAAESRSCCPGIFHERRGWGAGLRRQASPSPATA
ncbi:hypothetical protein P7K49_002151 [Saguinus oedipus]|uniref:Suppressor APC domain-containing protein n=1 Tax=Saguinus oedipus TaxID=9490 RepID=A0ABQ9WH40_SAGOE|nr:hypothetical protein P7K49_002151 [Saguinus oedipus]